MLLVLLSIVANCWLGYGYCVDFALMLVDLVILLDFLVLVFWLRLALVVLGCELFSCCVWGLVDRFYSVVWIFAAFVFAFV